MYVFFRTNLPQEHLLVQSCHAIQKLTAIRGISEELTPNIIAIGVRDQPALERVLLKLKQFQLPHYAWHEPDNDFGFTAIAVGPLGAEEREPLMRYQLYRPGELSNGFGRESATRAPDSPVAQLQSVCL